MFFKKLIMFNYYKNITTDWTVYIFTLFIIKNHKNLHGYGYKI